MKANSKLGKIKETIIFGRLLRASIAATAVFVLAFVLTPYILAEANAANVASAGVTWNEVSLTLDPDYGNGAIGDTGHGDVDFGTIVPTSVNGDNIGTMRVVKKNIGITTNGQFYSVYLSMADTSQSLVMSGSTLEIEPIDSTWSGTGDHAPAAFSETSWGFAVPRPSDTTTWTTPFTYNYGGYDTLAGVDLTASTHSSVYNQAAWAQVPASDNAGGPQQIWKATCVDTQTRTCSSTGFGTDSFPIYYGIMVDTDVMSGTYENEIVYTAMASSASLDSVSTNINRSTEFVKANTVETLSVDLSTSGVPLTKSDVEVYLIPHSVAVANNYAATTNFNTYKDDAHKCTIGSAAEDFVTTDHGLTLNCTLPSTGSPNGVDDGTTTTAASETSSGVQLGEFDIWLHVKTYNYDYISKYTRNTNPVASVVYAGLQSKDASGNTYVTKMQEMSQTICTQTNEWGTTLGANAALYDYSGTGTALATGATADVIGLGTFALTDSRDNKDYLVRRLADGNCWMVQNLDLELADFAGKKTAAAGALTPANTDIAALGVDYYDPTEITNNKITSSVTAGTGGVSPSQSVNVSANLASNNFVGLAKYMLGTTVDTTEQFQSYDLANGSHFWGTKCTATTTSGVITATTCDTSLAASAITNTVLSEIPRSYSNMVTSDKSTDFASATQFRYVPTSWETGQTRTQTMDATTGYPTAAASAFGNSATSIVTSTNAYVPTEKASSSSSYNYKNGTANTDYAPYESAADGSFYGTMYVGHYYNWYAATAESGSFSSSKSKDASICPAGWRLPQNGNSTTDYSWNKLIQGTYHVISYEGNQYVDPNADPKVASYTQSTDMHKLPLSLPFTGHYNWQYGNLNDRGAYGNFWSSSVSSTTNAYYLTFNSTNVYPQYYYNKVYGFTVRCVAR